MKWKKHSLRVINYLFIKKNKNFNESKRKLTNMNPSLVDEQDERGLVFDLNVSRPTEASMPLY